MALEPILLSLAWGCTKTGNRERVSMPGGAEGILDWPLNFHLRSYTPGPALPRSGRLHPAPAAAGPVYGDEPRRPRRRVRAAGTAPTPR